MLRSRLPREGFRLQGPVRQNDFRPAGIGRNAYARAQNVQRQAEMQAQGHTTVPARENSAMQDDYEQDVEALGAAVVQGDVMIDLTGDAHPEQVEIDTQGRYRYRQATGEGSLGSNNRERSSYRFGDIDLKPGTCVELREPVGKWGIRFVEIESVRRSTSDGTVVISGIPYARNRNLGGMLEFIRNDVCHILEVNDYDDRPDEAQYLLEIDPRQILRVRTLYKTNALGKEHQYGDDQSWYNKTKEEREEQAPIVCRWKFRMGYRDSQRRKMDRPTDFALIMIRQAEASPQFRCSDNELRFQWRGEKTIRGGSHKPDGGDQQYTLADMYCGAGGASHGAVMAGLKLVVGADHCPVACATMERNFPDARILQADITDLITNGGVDLSSPIDFLHLSPPCQPWSRFAYIHGREDPRKDLLLSCSDLLEKFRNRGFTLEQTSGFLDTAHEEYLGALIQGFTRLGFSIRWKSISLVQYGLPQTRERLVMFGFCPGEALPPWPPATHSAVQTRGLKPYVTEAEAIRGLSRSNRRDPLHDERNARPCNDVPRDANQPFRKTVLCNGPQGVNHFLGRREFTLRELACIQGFPRSHQIVGNKTEIKRQIGNAFPSCVVKVFYEHLREWLEHQDGVRSASTGARPQAPQLARPLSAVDQHLRGNLTPSVPVEPRNHVNGDLDDDEALQLALQESMFGPHQSDAAAIVDISGDHDEQQQHSTVAAVAPLLERMSIAPSESQPIASHGRESTLESRSRSVTLDFSPRSSPSPGPSRRAESGPQKRSIDSVHDGDADETMKKGSPPQRERMLEGQSRGDVDDAKIPSELPRYTGPQVALDGNDEAVLVSHTKRSSQGDVRKSGSTPRDRGSHRDAVVDDVAPRDSGRGLLNRLWQASKARTPGEEVWTFS